jgi:hypothetical protein
MNARTLQPEPASTQTHQTCDLTACAVRMSWYAHLFVGGRGQAP